MSLEIMVMTVMTKRNGMNGISRGPHRERQGLSQMKEVQCVSTCRNGTWTRAWTLEVLHENRSICMLSHVAELIEPVKLRSIRLHPHLKSRSAYLISTSRNMVCVCVCVCVLCACAGLCVVRVWLCVGGRAAARDVAHKEASFKRWQ